MKTSTLLLAGLLAAPALCGAQPGKQPAPAAAPASLGTITKGLQKFDGYFPFYYDPKTGKILLEISRFDEEFLYFGSLANGVGNGIERGQSSSAIAKFVRVGG